MAFDNTQDLHMHISVLST